MLQVDTSRAITDMRKFFEPLTPRQAKTAVSRSINEALTTGRAEFVRHITTVYTVKAMLVRQQLGIIRANSNTLVGKLRSVSRRHSMSDFKNSAYDVSSNSFRTIATRRINGKVAKRIETRAVTAKSFKLSSRRRYIGLNIEILKGQGKNIQSAFLMQSRGGMIWAGRGKYNTSYSFVWRNKREVKTGNDLPANKLLTPSIYAQTVNPKVQRPVGSKIDDRYATRLLHNLTVGLNHRGAIN